MANYYTLDQNGNAIIPGIGSVPVSQAAKYGYVPQPTATSTATPGYVPTGTNAPAIGTVNFDPNSISDLIQAVQMGTMTQDQAYQAAIQRAGPYAREGGTPQQQQAAQQIKNAVYAVNRTYTPVYGSTTNASGTSGSSTSIAPTANIQPPQVSLQPGTTNTAAVKQLQDWLVANGYMTQAQVNTGYGTYGPQTQQAVQQVQQKLGVDNSTGPGYWGTRTISAVNSAGNSAKAIGANTSPTNVSPQYALLSAIADAAQAATTLGKPPVSFADALALAQRDPNIIAKYADMLKIDTQSFSQQLRTAQDLYSSNAELQKTQFENERKALAEKQAAAGTAYSGFRSKAEKDLAQTESGIVTSSRAQEQNTLNQLTSAFEAKYGTGMTPNASITTTSPLNGNINISGLYKPTSVTDTVTGEKQGSITGSVDAQKKADILSSALNSYQTAQFPNVK